jgi:hypothetical protein
MILAGTIVGCGTTHTKTVYVPTSTTQAATKAPSIPQVTVKQLEAAASIKSSGGYHLTHLRAAGEWAMATVSGVPQPGQILFRETAGTWHVAREPAFNALPARLVPGMSAVEARVLGITIITPQAEQQYHERVILAEAERRNRESGERLERIERRERRVHEQTCTRLYREYQEGQPSVGEVGEVAPSGRAAIQEYGRMGCR